MFSYHMAVVPSWSAFFLIATRAVVCCVSTVPGSRVDAVKYHGRDFRSIQLVIDANAIPKLVR
mgnify:CR=1 FL=1